MPPPIPPWPPAPPGPAILCKPCSSLEPPRGSPAQTDSPATAHPRLASPNLSPACWPASWQGGTGKGQLALPHGSILHPWASAPGLVLAGPRKHGPDPQGELISESQRPGVSGSQVSLLLSRARQATGRTGEGPPGRGDSRGNGARCCPGSRKGGGGQEPATSRQSTSNNEVRGDPSETNRSLSSTGRGGRAPWHTPACLTPLPLAAPWDWSPPRAAGGSVPRSWLGACPLGLGAQLRPRNLPARSAVSQSGRSLWGRPRLDSLPGACGRGHGGVGPTSFW